jgi:hypothetical protein
MMLGNQPVQRAGVQQGHVAVADQHCPGQPGRQDVQRTADGVAGAVLLSLYGGAHVAAQHGAKRAEVGVHGLTAVADHHHQVLGSQPGGSPHRMLHQGTAGHRVQHLGGRRMHPGAFAGSQHDCCREAPVWEHRPVLSRSWAQPVPPCG